MGLLILVSCVGMGISTLCIERCDNAFYVALAFGVVGLLAIYKVWLDEKRRDNDRRVSWRYED